MKYQTKIATVTNAFSAEITQFSKRQKIAFCSFSLLGAFFIYSFFFVTIKYSVDFSNDEGFFLATCERFLRGDKLILHDWGLPQFVSLFQILPYSFYKRITGSTESIILFMRSVTVGVTFLNYCYILGKYRKNPWIALSTAFLFCSYVPLGGFILGYYLLPPVLLFWVASAIIDEEPQHREARLVLAGVLLSAAVILVPGLAVVWVLYFVFVVIRFIAKKTGTSFLSKYDFLLDVGTFKYLLLGVLICATAALAFLQFSCGLDNIVKMVPNLRLRPEYSRFDDTAIQNREGYRTFLRSYSSVVHLCIAETLAVFFFQRYGKRLKSAHKIKLILFFFNCLILFFSYFAIIFKAHRTKIILMESPVFIAWFGFNCLFLCNTRNPKNLFVWLLGAVLSFTQDLTSEISCCFGCIICVFPTVDALCRLVSELCINEAAIIEKREKKKRKKTAKVETRFSRQKVPLPCILGILALVVSLLWSTTNVIGLSYAFRITSQAKGQEVVSRGPYKGVTLPPKYKKIYDSFLEDIDLCMRMTEKPIYIMGNYPFGYLYMDRDIHVASTFNTEEQLNQKYWEVYPERKPEYIYIPIKEEESSINISQEEFDQMPKTQFVNYDWFEGEAEKGKIGLIVRVTEWHETA